MMGAIYLVRHGSHSLVDRVLCGRTDEVPLAAEGVAQAQRLAVQFAGIKVDVLRSSPRRRTRETAAPIGNAIGLEVECIDELDELDAGEWTGQSFAALELDERWHAWNARRGAARPPGGESMAETQARIVGYIEKLRSEGLSAAVLVTHAEPIRAALLHYRRMSLERFNEIEISPGSISVLQASASGVEVEACNLAVLS
jgi:broad specificity phosphatase PhoE